MVQASFRNRIIESGVKRADQFTAHPRNPKIHPAFQREVIKSLLGDIGWVTGVIESKNSGYLLDGHERVWAALDEGDGEPIPYTVVDVTEDEELKILATLDPSGYLAQQHGEVLKELMADMGERSEIVEQMLKSLVGQSLPTATFDPRSEWVGMPEFEQNSKAAPYSITVHFYTEDAIRQFSELVEQPLTTHTRFIYYPKIQVESWKGNRIEHES